MSEQVTDPNDPRLGHGVDAAPVQQHDAYLVLSDEERAKGFVRPVRRTYVHTGERPRHPIRDLTDEERERYARYGYVKFEAYPEGAACRGRYWTEKALNSGCGNQTRMSQEIAETYARNPNFYGSTYCVNCRMHLPVSEFTWLDDGTVVGS